MKIIDRHIGVGVFVTTLLGVAVLSLALVLGNVFRELLDLMINKNLPMSAVFAFILIVLPFPLTFTIPWAFLASTLLIFGRLSADHELVALQACGVSVLRLCVPVFLLSVALSGLCLWINVEAAPRAEQKMLTALRDFATRSPMAVFRPGEVVDQFPRRRIYVGGKEGDWLTNIIIFETNGADFPTRMIFAEEATLSRDTSIAGWRLHLYSARFEERDPADPANIEKIRPGVSFREGTSLLGPDKMVGETYRRQQALSAQTLPELSKFIAEGAGGDLSKATVEYHRRFSLAFACVAFALVGVPMGITVHRKETSIGFGISLVAAFAYFLLILLAQTFQSNPQAHPLFLIWLPNILFGLLGVILFFRLSRRG